MGGELLYSQISREEGTLHPGRPHGEEPGLVRKQRHQRENLGNNLRCGFHGKQWAGEVGRFRIGGLE